MGIDIEAHRLPQSGGGLTKIFTQQLTKMMSARTVDSKWAVLGNFVRTNNYVAEAH